MRKYFLSIIGLTQNSSTKVARIEKLKNNTKNLLKLQEALQERKTKNTLKTTQNISEAKQNFKEYCGFIEWWEMVQIYNPQNEILKSKFKL